MRTLIIFCACLLIFPSAAYSKQKKGAMEKTSWEIAMKTSKKLTSNDWLNVKIFNSERDTIKKYFQDNAEANWEGQAKSEEQAYYSFEQTWHGEGKSEEQAYYAFELEWNGEEWKLKEA